VSNTPLSLSERLAQHLIRDVDQSVRTKARLHLLDWMGCVASARHTAVAHALDGLQGASVGKAAFLGNVLEMDDVHRAALLHPGPVIWPVALNSLTDSMDDMLDAAVRGYEAMIAVGVTFDDHHYAHYHPTATAGVFGAAACEATASGADVLQLANALALAGSISGGVWQTRHSGNFAKQWHVAHAAETGESAARYALSGITGPLDILEGVQGLYAATCRAPRPMIFGDGWRIGEVSFKPWAACRHAHPAIDAALALRARGMLHFPITVESYADALAFCDRPDPTTPDEAKFSLQHAVAIVAMRGVPTLADFEPDAIAALADARMHITVREDPAITARYPDHFGATVRANGEHEALVDTLGDPERPLSRDGVIDKARALFAWGGLDSAEAERGVTLALDGDDAQAIVAWLEDIL
jgi:2-methylcitrate dehydratase PrpD